MTKRWRLRMSGWLSLLRVKSSSLLYTEQNAKAPSMRFNTEDKAEWNTFEGCPSCSVNDKET